jgi:hypothetical protein
MELVGPGCATAPKAKQPDERRRTPVNAEIPAELRQGRDPVRSTKNPTEVEWR